MNFQISGRMIGEDNPCFLIAEIGINHNGDIQIAKKLIDEAIKAGFDAVKLQAFSVDKLFHEKAGIVKFKGSTYPIREVNRKYEMPEEWLPELKKYAQDKKMILFSSACDEDSVDLLEKYDYPAYKMPSSALTHIPLQTYVAKTKKPILISTGASKLEEVKQTYLEVQKYNNKIALLHCVVSYPTPDEYANLNVIKTLKNTFPDAIMGYSDHTEHPYNAAVGAIVVGAKIIEKHITLDKNMEGPDHSLSIDPPEMKTLVQEVRKTEEKIKQGNKIKIDQKLLGKPEKIVYDIEEYSKRFSNQTIYASKNINKGQKFTKDNLIILRPGNYEKGIEPKYYDSLLNGEYVLIKNLSKNDPVKFDCLRKVDEN